VSQPTRLPGEGLPRLRLLDHLQLLQQKMAKIWKGHRGGSTRVYDIETLEEEIVRERPPETTALSSSFKSVSLLEPHPSSQIEEEWDQPLDLSSSKSNAALLNSPEEECVEGSDERDSNFSSNGSDSNESPLSERSFSPEVEKSPRRGPRLTRDEKWMVDEGLTDHISISDVINKDHAELKQTVEGLLQAGLVDERQAKELMHIRKRGRNKITAKKSRKKKDAEIDHLKKAVRDAQKKQKPVADEQRELFLQLAYWEEKFAELTRYLLISHGMHPDDYQVVVEGDDVQFVGRDVAD